MRRFLTVVWLALASIGCGSSYTPSPPPGRTAAPLASIYDFEIEVPGMIFAQFPATGLWMDLTLVILPGSLGPGDDSFEGSLHVNQVEVGGIVRPFSAATPLSARGTATGSELSLESFGPILVGDATTGTTSVMLALTGIVSADGRRIDGGTQVTSAGDTGSFHGVKQRRYLVAATDFGVTGTVSLIKVRFDTRFEIQRDLEAISGDPVARATGQGVYIVNRFFFDNIQSLDPASGFRTAVQFSTGNGSNPHDVLEVEPGRVYITRYEPPYNDILIADPATGDLLDYIDLGPEATNTSGTPRADGILMTQGRVFVSLQNIDSSFTEYGPGLVSVVDPVSDSIVRTITLSGRNPFGRPALHPDTGHLYYALAGVFQGSLPGDLSGGIEVLDPGSQTSLGLLIDDDDLGGNVSSVALARGQGSVLGYCVVTTPSSRNQVRLFDADTGDIQPAPILDLTSFLPEVISDGDGFILVPVRDLAAPRLVIIEASTGRVLGSIALSLPPFSVAVLTKEFLRS